MPRPIIRTLDAIHLASLVVARSAVAGLVRLTLDDRIRRTAIKLGVEVRPSQ